MRLDRLKIAAFKNLKDTDIDFDESEASTVLIGENGTGKSNVIEALVTIFRDLDLNESTDFDYYIKYSCHGFAIEIDYRLAGPQPYFLIDGMSVTRSQFFESRQLYLPDHVFGYYSGTSRRLEQLFDKHQLRYYKRVISPKSVLSDVNDPLLRRLFYCRSAYGQLALLSYFAFGSESAQAFLRRHLGIVGFDCALIVLRKPRWADSRRSKFTRETLHEFWGASGLVRGLLDKLWAFALAPVGDTAREQDDYRDKPSTEEQVYIFIKDGITLAAIAQAFGDERTFFALLETLDISDLIREVRIWVEKEDVAGEIPFHEISDGEKQLLSVLGLMRFTAHDESLFLLDEPDTHLNPHWKWDYLTLVKDVFRHGESHVILTSHDPLTIGSLCASQVQVLSRSEAGLTEIRRPEVDPRGLGFTSTLTQIFGLPTTLDPETQQLLDRRNHMLSVHDRDEAQELALTATNEELRKLGFVLEDREPEYELFLRAMAAVKRDRRATLSPESIVERNSVAKQIIARMLAQKSSEK